VPPKSAKGSSVRPGNNREGPPRFPPIKLPIAVPMIEPVLPPMAPPIAPPAKPPIAPGLIKPEPNWEKMLVNGAAADSDEPKAWFKAPERGPGMLEVRDWAERLNPPNGLSPE